MLAQDSAEIDTPDPLSETEKDLVMKVKCFMMREGVTLPELTSEIGVDINTLRSLTRYGMGIDEDPSMLPQSMRADAIQKLSSWVIDRESEEETVYQVERRMPGIHTFPSLAKHLGIDASRLGQLLTSQTSDWSPGEHAYKRKMLGLLSTWLDSDAEDDIAGIASTKTLDRLQKAYEQAFIKKRIVSIVGEVGIGKSLAAKHYWRQYPKTRRSNGVVYVEFRTGDTKENSILGRIVEVLYGQGLISTLSGDPMTIIEDIHHAKRRINLSDIDYRAMLQRVAGVDSSNDLDAAGFSAAMAELGRLGFQTVQQAPQYGERLGWATEPQLNYIRSLWRKWAGTEDEAGMAHFLDKHFKVSSLRFLDSATVPKVIVTFKRMAEQRKASPGRKPKGLDVAPENKTPFHPVK